MDPHIICEQPDKSDGQPLQAAEEGVAYLRRLKAQASEVPASRAVGNEVAAPVQASRSGITERRRSPRFQCSGSVEFQVQGDVRMWGKLTDISPHGCYVEMSSTFPVETPVSLTIESVGIRFSTQAVVRASYPALGMGMSFSEIKPKQQTQLEQLLMALTGRKGSPGTAPVERRDSLNCVATAEPRILVEKLTEYFKENGWLSRDAFHAIAKRVSRS
ncbi:MAG: PilZ domain-containing protein [Terriglobales bacterium]